VTILTFDTEENVISVKTYDTHTGKYRADSAEDYRFGMFPGVASAMAASNSVAPVTTAFDPFVFPMPRLTK